MFTTLYENNYMLADDDFYMVLFCGVLYDKYKITVNKIIYNINDQRDKFYLETLNHRRIEKDNTPDLMLSEEFCNNFPLLLNLNNKCVSNDIYVRDSSFENVAAFINFCNSIINNQDVRVLYNSATCYIHKDTLLQLEKTDSKFYDFIIRRT